MEPLLKFAASKLLILKVVASRSLKAVALLLPLNA